MTARWTPVASLVALTLAPGTIAPCASVTVHWSVAVDCAQSGATSNSIMKAAERNRNVVFGIRDSSLTGRGRGVRRRLTGKSRRTARQWTRAGASGAPMLARGMPGTKRLDPVEKSNPSPDLGRGGVRARSMTYDRIRSDESEPLDWSDLRG